MAEECTSFDLRISYFLNEHLRSSKVSVETVSQALAILGELAPPPRLFATLRSAMAHADPYVRSTCALALGRRVDSLPWIRRLAEDNDERVRANTVEALWGRKGAEIESVLLTALNDAHHRVAANAAFGLYLTDPERYLPTVGMFVNHALPGFRCAAAWIIGKIGNPEHMSMLKPLLLDKNDKVRRAGFKSLATLRSAKGRAA
jgi:HEAT repeat protein